MEKNNGIIIILILILLFSSFTLPSTSEINETEASDGNNVDATRALSDSPWPCEGGNAQRTGLSPYDTSDNPGKLIWKYDTGNNVYSSPTIGLNGTILFSANYNDDYYLYSINQNGVFNWRTHIECGASISPTVGSDGTIYMGSWKDYLYAINPNGTEKWKFQAEDNVESSPAIGSNDIIYVGSDDNYLYAIKPNGKLKWKFKTGNLITSSPAIGIDGTIYIGSWDNYLYAIKPDGTEKWKFKTGDIIDTTPAIGSDNTIYVGSEDKCLYAINPNGIEKWKYVTGGEVDSSPAIGPNNIIYVGSNDNNLYAINSNGTLRWKFSTDGGVHSSPAICSDGIVFIGSNDNYLYAINPNGTERWKYKTGGFVGSSPAIDKDGTVYIGSFDNHLYAIGTVTPPTSPQNLKATTGDEFVQLFWEPPKHDGRSPISQYKIYRREGSENGSILQTVGNLVYSFNDTSVINGLIYYYNVTAVNKIGESEPSNEFVAIPETIPSSPRNLQVRSNNDSVELSWTAPKKDGGSPILKYNIYRGTHPGNEGQYAELASSVTLYIDKNIIKDQTYYYFVTAVNSNGESPPSNKAIFPILSMANSPWPCFRGNAKRTGLSEFDTSDNPGKLRWKFNTGKPIYSSPVIGSDGTIYIGSNDYNLYAINPDASEKWKFRNGDEVRSSPLIQSDGTILIGSDFNWLFALDTVGNVKWISQTEDSVDSSPAIGSDGTIYIGSTDGYIYALHPFGTERWKVGTGRSVHSSPTVGLDGTIYIGSKYLYAIYPNGTIKWRFQTGNHIDSSPAIGSDGTIYIGSNGLFALNPDGSEKWNYSIDSKIESSPAIDSNGVIYIGSKDYNLYAFNSNGKLKWKFKTGDEIVSSPAIGSEGTIYIGSNDNYLYAINPDGTEKWKFETGDAVKSSPAIGSDGTVYIGSTDTNLYAIGKTPPEEPQKFKAIPGNGFIELTWTTPAYNGGSKVTGYNIYRGNTSDTFELLKTVDHFTTFFKDTSVSIRHTYYYYITAINAIGEGQSTDYISAKPLAIPTPPQELKASIWNRYVYLKWQSPADDGEVNISNYKIYRGNVTGNEEHLTTINPSRTSYCDTSVIIEQDYSYYVTALNIIGESESSNNVSINSSNIPIWPCSNGDFLNTGLSPYDTSNNRGKVSWQLEVGGEIETSPSISIRSSPIIASDGTIYLVYSTFEYDDLNYRIYNAYLLAINPDGTIRWEKRIGDHVAKAPVLGMDGTIYVGGREIYTYYSSYDYDDYLYAIDPNGYEKWKYNFIEQMSSPAISPEGNIYICDSWKLIKVWQLFALDTNGNKIWDFWADVFATPTIGFDGTIYLSSGGKLYAYYNESLVWDYDGFYGSPTIDKNGNIYGYSGNNITALNPDGKEKLTFSIENEISSSPRIGHDGTIYVGSGENLIAVNSDGKIKWKFELDGRLSSSPVIGAEGTIYIGSKNYQFYAINPNGTLKWQVEFDSEIVSPAIGSDGTIYFAYTHNNNGYLCALSKSTPTPPQNFIATNENEYIALTWNAPDDDGGDEIIEYRIYRNKDQEGKTLLTTLDSLNTSYQDYEVEPEHLYIYYITAVNKVGESNFSFQHVAYTLTGPFYYLNDGINDVILVENKYLDIEPGGKVEGHPDIDMTNITLWKAGDYLLFEMDVVGIIQDKEMGYDAYMYTVAFFMDENDDLVEQDDADYILNCGFGMADIRNEAYGGKESLKPHGFGTSTLRIVIPLSYINHETDFEITVFAMYVSGIHDVNPSEWISEMDYTAAYMDCSRDITFGTEASDSKKEVPASLFSSLGIGILIIIILIIIIFVFVQKKKKSKLAKIKEQQPPQKQKTPILTGKQSVLQDKKSRTYEDTQQPKDEEVVKGESEIKSEDESVKDKVEYEVEWERTAEVSFSEQYKHQQYPLQREPRQQYLCQHCQQPLTYIEQHQRWYCDNCRRYV